MKELTYADLFADMTDMSTLASPPSLGERGGSDSSYDPESRYDAENDVYLNWGANWDNRGKRYTEGEAWVIFDRSGPGVIRRIWSGSFMFGRIKIYIDDMTRPEVDEDYRYFMEKFRTEPENYNCPLLSPLLSRGVSRLIPIPFNKRCKIVLYNGLKPAWWFYNINYTIYPPDVRVPVYNGKVEAAYGMGLIGVQRALYNRGEYPYPSGNPLKTTVLRETFAPGESKVIYSDDEPGAITAFVCDLEGLTPSQRDCALDGLTLKIYWDGEKEPSVLSPLGAFFGSHPGYNNFKTYPCFMTQNRCGSCFYMPYRGAKIIIEGGSVAYSLKFTIITEHISSDKAESLMRFHAYFRTGGDWDGLDRARFEKGGDRSPDYPLARLTGTGRFCGFALHVTDSWENKDPAVDWQNGQRPCDVHQTCHWWGEGDEKFFVDGEKFPSTFGTGSEDYFGFSFAANHPFITFDSAYSAQSRVPSADGNGETSVVRFQVSDNVPFFKSFDAFLEKYLPERWTEGETEGVCVFSSTVYWYKLHEEK